MVIVVANGHIRAENLEEALSLYGRLVEETRKENGCIQYDLLRDTQDPGHLTVLEKWASQEALDAHMKTPHFTEIIPQIGKFHEKEGVLSIYEQVI